MLFQIKKLNKCYTVLKIYPCNACYHYWPKNPLQKWV